MILIALFLKKKWKFKNWRLGFYHTFFFYSKLVRTSKTQYIWKLHRSPQRWPGLRSPGWGLAVLCSEGGRRNAQLAPFAPSHFNLHLSWRNRGTQMRYLTKIGVGHKDMRLRTTTCHNRTPLWRSHSSSFSSPSHVAAWVPLLPFLPPPFFLLSFLFSLLFFFYLPMPMIPKLSHI